MNRVWGVHYLIGLEYGHWVESGSTRCGPGGKGPEVWIVE